MKPTQTMRTALLIATLALAGCQGARVATPLTAELSGSDPGSQLEFWHTLTERPVTSNDEAFHGILLFVDSKDDAKSYDERVAAMRARKMLPAGFAEPADQAVTRGTVAVALTRALQIKGGLMMHLLSNSPRYATREMVFLDLFPPSSPHQTFSGTEFVGIIGRAEDYQRGNPAEHPAAVLPGEMNQPGAAAGPATAPAPADAPVAP